MTNAFMQGGLKKVGELISTHSYPIIEDFINEGIIDSSASKGKKVTCTKGCDSCCHEQVLSQGIEGFAAASWINKQPRALRKQISKKLDNWHKETTRAGIELSLTNPETAYLQAKKYWEANIPCPFLNKGACSIYPVRPFACRTMLVTSDPKDCKKSNVNAIKVQSNKFEQLVRSEFLALTKHVSNFNNDNRQQDIVNMISWFPYITKLCLD